MNPKSQKSPSAAPCGVLSPILFPPVGSRALQLLISPLAAALIMHVKPVNAHTRIKKLEGGHTLCCPQGEAGPSSGATWLLGTCSFH